MRLKLQDGARVFLPVQNFYISKEELEAKPRYLCKKYGLFGYFEMTEEERNEVLNSSEADCAKLDASNGLTPSNPKQEKVRETLKNAKNDNLSTQE